MNKKIFAYLFLFPLNFYLQAQNTYSIEDLIEFYVKNGINVKNNYTKYQIDSLHQINNRNIYKLQSDFSFSLPYSKSISPIIQPDGTNNLLETNNISPMLQFSLRKKVVFLGGDLSFYSNLNGYNDFINGNKQYGLTWFNIQYSQKFFGFNEYKYGIRKIKLEQERDKQSLLFSNFEDITDFVDIIFQYYINIQLIEENDKNINTNKELLKNKRILSKHGKVLATDTLNIYLLLNKLQIKNNYFETKKLLLENKIKYYTFINNEFEVSISNVPLTLFLEQNLLSERYLKYALQKDDELEMFELDSDIARNKKNTGIETSISLGAGFNSKSEEHLYNINKGRPTDRENISLSLSIPISGWNTYKNKREMALLKKKIYLQEQENNIKEAEFWSYEIIEKYKQALLLIELANRNLEASQELEQILVKNIENGQSDYVALFQLYTDNQAILLEKYTALRDIYILKYELIQKTFFDFENNVSVQNY